MMLVSGRFGVVLFVVIVGVVVLILCILDSGLARAAARRLALSLTAVLWISDLRVAVAQTLRKFNVRRCVPVKARVLLVVLVLYA